MIAVLALEDGTCLTGVSAGAPGETSGEVVFNTSLTGYQEVLTDPSYAGQIVTMTAPQIGNYGVAEADEESTRPQVAGFVIRDASPLASNWRAQSSLRDYLVTHGIVAIADVDTRALTRRLRSGGVLRGIIATGAAAHDTEALVQRARGIPSMEGSDLVTTVTCRAPYDVALSAEERAADEAFALKPAHVPAHPLRWRRSPCYWACPAGRMRSLQAGCVGCPFQPPRSNGHRRVPRSAPVTLRTGHRNRCVCGPGCRPCTPLRSCFLH